jgi:hypothetical protein
MRWLLFWRPPCLLRTVIVNVKHDDSSAIKGVLWSTRGPWLTFRNCELLKPGQTTTIDGDVVIHRSTISFLQVLP